MKNLQKRIKLKWCQIASHRLLTKEKNTHLYYTNNGGVLFLPFQTIRMLVKNNISWLNGLFCEKACSQLPLPFHPGFKGGIRNNGRFVAVRDLPAAPTREAPGLTLSPGGRAHCTCSTPCVAFDIKYFISNLPGII